MYRQIFKPDASGNWYRGILNQTDTWITTLFLIAALALFCLNLGELPLRDWDEGIVAQVARNIGRSPDLGGWLYPTLANQPYLNKPPLMHWLIASAYHFGGVNEWMSRLPSAILTACSVPLLYGIGLEIFPKRTPAIFSSLIYLTLLPIVRHGRLAMLDGAVLCFFLLTLWCLLRGRRDFRYTLGAGLGLGLICLTKSIIVLLLGAIALLFLLWDTPRLLKSPYLWLGLLLGMMPATFWFGAQYLHYGIQFIKTTVQDQTFSRIWQSVENRSGPLWYYLLEIVKYSLPWLLFFPLGLRLAWLHRNTSWAKLVLVWSSFYFTAISLMNTKLPWYVLPLYPALALAGGVALTEIWHADFWGIPQKSYRLKTYLEISLGLISIVGWSAFSYFTFLRKNSEINLILVIAAIALTITVAAILINQSDRQFLIILFWGIYVSLSLFMLSPYWVWELGEAYPVKPVAAMIQARVPVGIPIYTSFPGVRPSLDFYSDRYTIPASISQLRQYWNQTPNPYLLLDRKALKKLHTLQDFKLLGTALEWVLITKDQSSSLKNPIFSIPYPDEKL